MRAPAAWVIVPEGALYLSVVDNERVLDKSIVDTKGLHVAKRLKFAPLGTVGFIVLLQMIDSVPRARA